jgi:glycosyltransferase involved in cell wall biosynthesis
MSAQTSQVQQGMTRRVLELGMGWFAEEPGGLNRMYAGLYEAMLRQRAAVCGLVAGRRDKAGTTPAGMEFFAPRDAGWLSRYSACRRSARTLLEGTDVVAAHFAPYALPVLDLIGKRRFVFHFHGPWASESRVEREGRVAVLVKRVIERHVYRRADRCIVLSRAFGDLLEREYGVERGRIHVVPGGVEAARFSNLPDRDTCRARFGLPAGRAVVGTVRRLVHRVGMEMLLEAMEQLRAQVPEALLAVAGTGPLAADLARRVTERELQQHVRFLGFIADADLPYFYGACDLTVVPSIALEGFGLTTIESMASGTPVLVTPVGGLPETVEALNPSLVLPEVSVPALAAGLGQALRNLSALPRGAACIDHVRRNFDWPVIARRTQEVYFG